MAIHFDATYEDGVLRPQTPLDLPNSTPVHVTVVPRGGHAEQDQEDESLPDGPRLTVDQFLQIMRKGTFRANSLPVDFDRDDIYADHD